MSHDRTPSTVPGDYEPLDVVIAGAGVAGLEACFALRALAGEQVDLTLLAPAEEFVYRPMSVREPFSTGRARRYPLTVLAASAAATISRDALTAVDAGHRRVRTSQGAELTYDALLVCPGAAMHRRYTHVTTIDDERIDEQLHGLVQDIEGGYVRHLAVVVPPMPPWPLPAYELALMCAERAWDTQTEMKVTLLTPEPAPLAAFGRAASLGLSRLLAERGVDVVSSAYCEVPSSRTVKIRPGGRVLDVDRIVALPELRGRTISGLAQDDRGFIMIDEHGHVRGTERVWAAGDVTDFPIKHGGVAAQMADSVARSIASLVHACPPPPPFEPVLEGVLLTGGTPRYVRGDPTGGRGDHSTFSRVSGRSRPPKIAARYLTPHLLDLERAAVRV